MQILIHSWCINMSYFDTYSLTILLGGWFSRSISMLHIFNRPGVAWADLQSPQLLSDWFIDSLSDPFPQNLQNIITTKLLEQESLNFETMFTTPCVSCVMFHTSCATCQVSRVMCLKHFVYLDKFVELAVGGSVINGATPSSFET